jgi:hypothetical protein
LSDDGAAATAVGEAELLLLNNSAGKLSGSWELDIFILPIPIGPKSSRPHFPLCFLAVERQLGLIIGTQMSEPWISPEEQQGVVIEMLKSAKQLPRIIRVKSEKVKGILQPLATNLGINLQVGAIPLLEEAKASLKSHFCGRGA